MFAHSSIVFPRFVPLIWSIHAARPVHGPSSCHMPGTLYPGRGHSRYTSHVQIFVCTVLMRPLKACLCVSHVVHAESLLCSSINKVFLLNISSTSYSTSNSSNTAQIENRSEDLVQISLACLGGAQQQRDKKDKLDAVGC